MEHILSVSLLSMLSLKQYMPIHILQFKGLRFFEINSYIYIASMHEIGQKFSIWNKCSSSFFFILVH